MRGGLGSPVVPGRVSLGLAVALLGSCASTPPSTAAGTDTVAVSTVPPLTVPPEVATTMGPADGPVVLRRGSEPLVAGTYTAPGFTPSVTFAVESDGWVVGTLSDGFFDIQQDPGAPDVIAVQFGKVLSVVGAGGSMEPAGTAADVKEAIKGNPALMVVGESASRLGGLSGFAVEVDNVQTTTAQVLRVAVGVLGFDPGRSLWISLLDSPNGVVAVIVGSATADRERALRLAEPVLQSVAFGS